MEKRPGGKVVTVAEGLDPKASDMDGLLKKLKIRRAAGGTVEKGKMEVQGIIGRLLVKHSVARGIE
jgi:translation initiation factor 1 (eIF-1/SUI1)